MTVINGTMAFGFFEGNLFKRVTDSIHDMISIKNELPKKAIIDYIESRTDQLGYSTMCYSNDQFVDVISKDMLPYQPGIYTIDRFVFPVEFPYYMEKYGVGVPKEFEEFVKKELELESRQA